MPKSPLFVEEPEEELKAIAARIVLAGQTGQAVPPATASAARTIGIEEAYRIQEFYNHRMQKKYGSVTGYKVAYASNAAQGKSGINTPAFGCFFDKQQVPNVGSVTAGDYIQMLVEAEVAFVMADDVAVVPATVEALMPYLASVHVGLDVPNNRFDTGGSALQLADMIAMSCGTQTYVLGSAVKPETVDFRHMQLDLTHDGRVVYQGAAANVLNDPRNSVLLLAKHLLARGTMLRKGDVVLSGAVAPAYVPETVDQRRGRYVGSATGLPPVKLQVD